MIRPIVIGAGSGLLAGGLALVALTAKGGSAAWAIFARGESEMVVPVLACACGAALTAAALAWPRPCRTPD